MPSMGRYFMSIRSLKEILAGDFFEARPGAVGAVALGALGCQQAARLGGAGRRSGDQKRRASQHGACKNGNIHVIIP